MVVWDLIYNPASAGMVFDEGRDHGRVPDHGENNENKFQVTRDFISLTSLLMFNDGKLVTDNSVSTDPFKS